MDAEVDAAGIADGGIEGAKDEFGAWEIDGLADQCVDNLHERGLNGFFTLEESDVMEARVRRAFDGTEHALVEIAELLSAKSGGTATNSGDLDVSADFDAWVIGHIGPINNFLVVTS